MAKKQKLVSVGKIEVEGVRALQKQLRTLDDKALKAELRKVNKDAATIVADEAKNLVPVRSGRLKASIGARGGLHVTSDRSPFCMKPLARNGKKCTGHMRRTWLV